MALSEQQLKKAQERLKEIKRQKIELLSQFRDYRKDNLIEFFNKPREEHGLPANRKQALLLEAWNNPHKKVFTYTGGNRCGKTTIGVIISICVAAGEWLWSGEKILFPHNFPRKIRIIGQDWESHVKTVVIPELKKWWPKKRGVKTKKNNVGVENLWIDEKTGSSIEIMSNKQEVDVFEGWQGDLIYNDEPPKREVRVANARGLVDRQGRELYCMTLLKEAWVDREVIKARLPDGRPDSTVFNVHATIYDNVGYGISQEGVDQFEKTLSDDEKQARLHGVPSYMSGLVCPKFKRDIHLVERFDIPSNWMVDIAIDIHPRKEQAVLFTATNPQQERYCCFEIWDHGDGPETADKVVRIINRNALRVNRIICDPLAKGDSNNDNTTFDKMKMVFARHGYILEVGSKDKQSGIIEINRHLEGPNKKPSIFFFDDLIRSIYEIEGWMYDADTQKPQKEDDDMMENLYRTLLLDTHYIEPEDEDYEEEAQPIAVNAVTGY